VLTGEEQKMNYCSFKKKKKKYYTRISSSYFRKCVNRGRAKNELLFFQKKEKEILY